MTSEVSPTARALRALELLRYHPGITAADLARRLGVSERAGRRYVAILREAGVPVQSTRGPLGGYTLGRGATLAPVVFTEVEALSLVMAVIDSHPGAASAGAQDDVTSALDKVVRVLPTPDGRQATALRQHASAAPDRHPSRPDPVTTSVLVAASVARQRVRLSYTTEAGSTWDALVDPWAVVVRHGRWYLLCHSHVVDAVRTLRVDRVSAVREVEERFTPPADLDPVASLEEHLGIGWEYDTRVVFEGTRDEVKPWVHPAMGRLGPHEDGCVLEGSTSNPTMYAAEWLARIPVPFRVVGGPELRSATRAVAARLGR